MPIKHTGKWEVTHNRISYCNICVDQFFVCLVRKVMHRMTSRKAAFVHSQVGFQKSLVLFGEQGKRRGEKRKLFPPFHLFVSVVLSLLPGNKLVQISVSILSLHLPFRKNTFSFCVFFCFTFFYLVSLSSQP